MKAAVAELYTIPEEHLELRCTVRRIARERVAPRTSEIQRLVIARSL